GGKVTGFPREIDGQGPGSSCRALSFPGEADLIPRPQRRLATELPTMTSACRGSRPARTGGRSVRDLLPSLLGGRRQLIHVLQEERERPHLLRAEHVPPGRHAGPADAVLELPVGHALGIVLDT